MTVTEDKMIFEDLETKVRYFSPKEMTISPPSVFHEEEQLIKAVHYVIEKMKPLYYEVYIEILYEPHTLYKGKVNEDIDDDFLEFLMADGNYKVGYLEVVNDTLFFEMCFS